METNLKHSNLKELKSIMDELIDVRTLLLNATYKNPQGMTMSLTQSEYIFMIEEYTKVLLQKRIR